MKTYNIQTISGELLLGCAVDLQTAEVYLKRYTERVGKPFPNGEGMYADLGYHIVESDTGYLPASFFEHPSQRGNKLCPN